MKSQIAYGSTQYVDETKTASKKHAFHTISKAMQQAKMHLSLVVEDI